MPMEAKQAGVAICAEGVDIVQHQGFELRLGAEQIAQGAVENEVGQFKPMSHRVEALRGQIVRVVGGFPGGFRPLNQGGVQTVAHLLFLFIQSLVTGLLPGKTQVALHRNHSQADIAPR